MTGQDARLDLGAYRRFVVAFSGGKDSLAALLHLLSLGVPPHAIELNHHDVDGHGPTFMDWPCTPGYVRAIAEHLGIALYVSWREGGFARELAREAAPTAPILFETPMRLRSPAASSMPVQLRRPARSSSRPSRNMRPTASSGSLLAGA